MKSLKTVYLVGVGSAMLVLAIPALGTDVGKWGLHKINLTNTTFSGNPFQLEVSATFTHKASDTKLKQNGFYAGENTWQIRFMPNKLGEWTWRTHSKNRDLNGKTGSLNCVDSRAWGPIYSDPKNPTRWKYADGPHVVPVIPIFTLYRYKVDELGEILAWFKDMGVTHVDVEFTNPELYWGKDKFHFNLQFWNHLDKVVAYFQENGIGLYTPMMYGEGMYAKLGDEEEMLFHRYLLARLSAYPVFFWAAGNDWDEDKRGRAKEWARHFGDMYDRWDPWQRPRGVRDGGRLPNYNQLNLTFYSGQDENGDYDIQKEFYAKGLPVVSDDRWREDRLWKYAFKNPSPDDLRMQAWTCLMVGGAAFIIGDGHPSHRKDPRDSEIYPEKFDTFEAKDHIKYMQVFMREHLSPHWPGMTIHNELVSKGWCMADPGKAYLVYLIGRRGNAELLPGETLSVDLSAAKGKKLHAYWYNPRTGDVLAPRKVKGGGKVDFEPPIHWDAVLLVSETPRSIAAQPPSPSVPASDKINDSFSTDTRNDYRIANWFRSRTDYDPDGKRLMATVWGPDRGCGGSASFERDITPAKAGTFEISTDRNGKGEAYIQIKLRQDRDNYYLFTSVPDTKINPRRDLEMVTVKPGTRLEKVVKGKTAAHKEIAAFLTKGRLTIDFARESITAHWGDTSIELKAKGAPITVRTVEVITQSLQPDHMITVFYDDLLFKPATP